MAGELDLFARLSEQHDSLIIDGKIPIEGVNQNEVVNDCCQSTIQLHKDNNMHILTNVLPLAIGFFPADWDIVVNSILCDYRSEVYTDIVRSINKVRHLMLFLRNQGQDHFVRYQVTLKNKTITCTYGENALTVQGLDHNDFDFLRSRILDLDGPPL